MLTSAILAIAWVNHAAAALWAVPWLALHQARRRNPAPDPHLS
jgi:hypothetical protein